MHSRFRDDLFRASYFFDRFANGGGSFKWPRFRARMRTLVYICNSMVACHALGSSTCMQIECVINYHTMNTASSHIHRNLLHTPHTLTAHCACKHSMYTFSCRLFRESSQVCVPGLEIITQVMRLHDCTCNGNSPNGHYVA